MTSREETEMTRVTYREACGKTSRRAVERVRASGETWRVERNNVVC